jgi:hypothetical protein
MFIAALFTIAKLWNQPRCPPVDERIIWHAHTMEHSDRNKNEIMTFEEKWIELEIRLSKTSQIQKDKFHIFFSCVESRSSVCVCLCVCVCVCVCV